MITLIFEYSSKNPVRILKTRGAKLCWFLSPSLPIESIDPLYYSRISLLLYRHIFISLPLLYFSLLFQCIFNFFSRSSYQFILLLFSPFHFGTLYVHLQFRKIAPLEILKSMQCFEGFLIIQVHRKPVFVKQNISNIKKSPVALLQTFARIHVEYQ